MHPDLILHRLANYLASHPFLAASIVVGMTYGAGLLEKVLP